MLGEDGLTRGSALVAGRVHVTHDIAVLAAQLHLAVHEAVVLARQVAQPGRVPRLRLHVLERPEIRRARSVVIGLSRARVGPSRARRGPGVGIVAAVLLATGHAESPGSESRVLKVCCNKYASMGHIGVFNAAPLCS